MIQVKAKKNFGNKDLMIVAVKLFSAVNQRIGLLIVWQCCNYWGSDRGNSRPSTNIKRMKKILSHLEGEQIGTIYCIELDGKFSHHQLGSGARRFVLIQVCC